MHKSTRTEITYSAENAYGERKRLKVTIQAAQRETVKGIQEADRRLKAEGYDRKTDYERGATSTCWDDTPQTFGTKVEVL